MGGLNKKLIGPKRRGKGKEDSYGAKNDLGGRRTEERRRMVAAAARRNREGEERENREGDEVGKKIQTLSIIYRSVGH